MAGPKVLSVRKGISMLEYAGDCGGKDKHIIGRVGWVECLAKPSFSEIDLEDKVTGRWGWQDFCERV